jgi:hypothetical protein
VPPFWRLPTHKQHVLFACDLVAVANAHTIGVEAEFRPMLEKRLPVDMDDFAFNNIDINCADRRAVVSISAAKKNTIDIAVNEYR